MKKIIVIAFLLIGSVCFGQGVQKVNTNNYSKPIEVKRVCVSGFLFVVARSWGNNGVSIVQVFRTKTGWANVVPVRCKEQP